MACTYDIPFNQLLQPKIEAELAFVLRDDLTGGHVTPEDVRNATAYVAGAFEIVDSRISDWKIRLPDTIADNASSARYVLGEALLPLDELDPAAVTMKMYKKGGGLIGEGSGAAVMGDPLLSVAWLANALYRYGVPLKAGEIILSGAFCAAPPAQKGDIFVASFSQLGTVEARFV
jgi:2-keto-4-pentenoate hydratase